MYEKEREREIVCEKANLNEKESEIERYSETEKEIVTKKN